MNSLLQRSGIVLVALAGVALQSSLVAAQTPEGDATGGSASREALLALQHRYELFAASPAYSPELRGRAEALAERIARRLERGDFQVGDVIYVSVEREPTLTDSFRVETGRFVTLPTVGVVPLDGVLRSELANHLTSEIGRYVRDPVVRVATLIRISVVGGVGRPGFYSVQSDALLTATLMAAGGPTATAQLDDITVDRAGDVILRGGALRDAVSAGRTLDELGIRAGDRIMVGQRTGGLGALQGPLQALSFALTLPAAIFGLTRIF